MRLGDLDALKEELGKTTVTIIGYGRAVFLDKAYEIIDNAPTVVEDYDTGYQDGLEDGLNDIRPQGEWINLIDIKNLYKCSICGRTIGLTYNETLSDYPFCHCGADMRGKEE